jgi:hypothetical protein
MYWGVAQFGRAPDSGSGCSGFETLHPSHGETMGRTEVPRAVSKSYGSVSIDESFLGGLVPEACRRLIEGKEQWGKKLTINEKPLPTPKPSEGKVIWA